MLEVGFANGGGVFCKSFHIVPIFKQGRVVAIGYLYENYGAFLIKTKNI